MCKKLVHIILLFLILNSSVSNGYPEEHTVLRVPLMNNIAQANDKKGHSESVASPKIGSLVEMCWAAWFEENYSTAVRLADEIIAIDPYNLKALELKAGSLTKLHRYEEAELVNQRIVELEPDKAIGWVYLANTLYQLGRYKEALEKVETAIQLGSINNRNTYQLLEKISRKLKKFDILLRAHLEVEKLKPDDPEIKKNLALTYLSLKRYDEALAAVEAAVALDGRRNPDSLAVLAIILSKQNRYEELLNVQLEITKLQPNNAKNWLQLALTYYTLERYEEALGALEKVNSKDVDSLRLKGIIYTKQREYQKAVAPLEEALKIKPNDVGLFGLLANAYYESGDYTNALARVKEALNGQSDNVGNLELLAKIYYALEMYQETLATLEKARQLFPTNLEIEDFLLKVEEALKVAVASEDVKIEAPQDPMFLAINSLVRKRISPNLAIELCKAIKKRNSDGELSQIAIDDTELLNRIISELGLAINPKDRKELLKAVANYSDIFPDDDIKEEIPKKVEPEGMLVTTKIPPTQIVKKQLISYGRTSPSYPPKKKKQKQSHAVDIRKENYTKIFREELQKLAVSLNVLIDPELISGLADALYDRNNNPDMEICAGDERLRELLRCMFELETAPEKNTFFRNIRTRISVQALFESL